MRPPSPLVIIALCWALDPSRAYGDIASAAIRTDQRGASSEIGS